MMQVTVRGYCLIEKFSKVSGLEVNRSKSECLLLDFEGTLSEYDDNFMGIPVVDNLKILGHFHGKNKIICDFQNFYCKLEKIERVMNIWKQRHLTIMGKNLLINALMNSLFIFNCQIENPPPNFIKLVDEKNKTFLWGGTAKIAHHSIIGDYSEGGIKYKDLACLISSVNVKFLFNRNNEDDRNSFMLPKLWIQQLFKINPTNENDQFKYFNKSINILYCKLKFLEKLCGKVTNFITRY